MFVSLKGSRALPQPNLSWLLLQKGALKEAAAIAERVLKVDECDDKAWSNLATARLRTGNFEGGLLAAKRAASIDPYNPGYDTMVGEDVLLDSSELKSQIRLGIWSLSPKAE